MKNYVLYHNPRCSKSREALKILEESNIHPKIKLYLDEGLSKKELQDLILKLKDSSHNLVRKKEELYKELNIDVKTTDEMIELLVKYPKLLERPILTDGSRAVIGRPTENIYEFIK